MSSAPSGAQASKRDGEQVPPDRAVAAYSDVGDLVGELSPGQRSLHGETSAAADRGWKSLKTLANAIRRELGATPLGLSVEPRRIPQAAAQPLEVGQGGSKRISE
jgi:hypothetical protein